MNSAITVISVALLGIANTAFAQRPEAEQCPVPLPEIQYAESSAEASSGTALYRLAEGDVLGIFIEGVVGASGSNPPVHYQDDARGILTSMGYPIPVRENGTVSLPLVPPLSVEGLSVGQAESLIRNAYVEGQFLNSENRILVSLMRKRTINVTVLRQDDSFSARANRGPNLRAVNNRSDQSQRGVQLQLPAGENSLLNAMIQSGGVPGVNAKAIHVIRAHSPNTSSIKNSQSEPASASPFPRSNRFQGLAGKRNHSVGQISSYPLQTRDRSIESLRARSRNLNTGDVVRVEAKPTEVYYTGGTLPGREFELPRDKALDILEAISIAGGTLTSGAVGSNSIQPTALTILRKTGPGQQLQITVDLRDAFSNPALRYKVQAGDYLLLEYRREQQLLNFGLQTFRTYGLRQLFR